MTTWIIRVIASDPSISNPDIDFEQSMHNETQKINSQISNVLIQFAVFVSIFGMLLMNCQKLLINEHKLNTIVSALIRELKETKLNKTLK